MSDLLSVGTNADGVTGELKAGTVVALQVTVTAVNVPLDFKVGTNKFTVAAATGNTVAAGTLTAASIIPSGSSIPTNGMFLPAANTLGWAINSAEKLRLDSSGVLNTLGGLNLTSVAGTSYVTGSFTATATGYTTTVTGTCKYTKIGNAVIMTIPTFSGTSNSTGFTLTGLPAALSPATDQVILVRTVDNGGTAIASYALIQAGTTTFLIYNGIAGDAFTGSGNKQIGTQALAFDLQ